MSTESHPKLSSGIFSLLWAGITGKLRLYPKLTSKLSFIFFLHIFTLSLAIASGFLGYTRARSFFSDFTYCESIALIITVFVATFAYIFTAHTMSQIGYVIVGGKLRKGEGFGLAITLCLTVSVISFDLYMNHSSVEPVVMMAHKETDLAHQRQSVMTRYDSLITTVEKKIHAHEKKHFEYRGKIYVPSKAGRYNAQTEIDQYQQLVDEKEFLMERREQDLVALDNQEEKIQEYHHREETRMKSVVSYFVYLIYVFMGLASLGLGVYSKVVTDIIATPEIQEKKPSSPKPKKLAPKEKSQEVPQPVTESELVTPLQNGHIQASPTPELATQLRKRDEEKYQAFLVSANEVYDRRGRYVKTDIAKTSGLARDTVAIYLTQALEDGDLVN